MKITLSLITAVLLAQLIALHAADAPMLLPSGWNPKTDADRPPHSPTPIPVLAISDAAGAKAVPSQT